MIGLFSIVLYVQSHVQNRWSMQHGKIIIQEAEEVMLFHFIVSSVTRTVSPLLGI